MRSLVSAFLLAAFASGCVLPPPRVSPYGRKTSLHTKTYRVDGELLSVTPDTIWMLTRPAGTVAPFPTASLLRLDVQRHPMGAMRSMTLMTYVGLGAGAALTLACAQVDDASGCGAVLPVTTLMGFLAGAFFGAVNFESAWLHLSRTEVSKAVPYTRYPQGLPDTLRARLEHRSP